MLKKSIPHKNLTKMTRMVAWSGIVKLSTILAEVARGKNKPENQAPRSIQTLEKFLPEATGIGGDSRPSALNRWVMELGKCPTVGGCHLAPFARAGKRIAKSMIIGLFPISVSRIARFKLTN